MSNQPKIYVAGHRGMVGSAIVRELLRQGHSTIITRSRDELDLTNQAEVQQFFESQSIDQVYLAAARVGGIQANNIMPAEFIYQNLMIQSNVIHHAWKSGVEKLLFLGSSCIYPKMAMQPMQEIALLTGALEPTNEPYAVAKIAGIKLCESYNRQYAASDNVDYRSVMPTNLYGPGDNFHPENSHVIPGLIRRFHEAKINRSSNVTIWGTGLPKREFLFVDDMAAASVHVMNLDAAVYQRHTEPMLSHINVGSGEDLTIQALAELIGEAVGYKGRIVFDETRSDGAPRKLMDSSRINALGWSSEVSLPQGLEITYREYLKLKNT